MENIIQPSVVPPIPQNKNIYKYLFFISLIIFIGTISLLFYFLNQKINRLSSIQTNPINTVATISPVLTLDQTATLVPTKIEKIDPKQTLVSLQKYLKVSSPVNARNNTFWLDQDKQLIPLNGQDFSLAGTMDNTNVGKYGNYTDLYSITADSFNQLRTSLDSYFTSNGFQKDKINTYNDLTLSTNLGYIYIAYTKNNLKCLITLQPQSDPFGDFFCGTIDQKQITWLQELRPVINPTNSQDIYVYVEKLAGNYAKGGAGGRSGGGYGWIAAKVNNQWKLVYSGQDTISCQTVNEYKIPKDIYVDCY